MENENINLSPAPAMPVPFWKNRKIILTAAVVAAVIIIFTPFYFIFWRQKINFQTQYNNLVKQQEAAEKNAGSQKTSDSRFFVFIKNADKDSGKQLFTVPSDFYSDSAGGIEDQIEYENDRLYVVRKMDAFGGGELWRFGKKDQFGKTPPGIKLYSGNDLKFKVSPGGKYIAVTASEEKEKLSIINSDGSLIREYNTRELGFSDDQGFPFWFGLSGWNTSENEFWGTIGNKPLAEAVYKISAENWEIKKFNFSFSQEWDFNTDSGKIIYSDCPVAKNSAGAEVFRNSETKVTLEIYDVESEQRSMVDSAVSKCFDPKWLSSQVIEYNNPSGDGRISKIIN
jgi:hypothetical protein